MVWNFKREEGNLVELEKQMFGKEKFAGPGRDRGDTERNFNRQTLLGLSLSTHLGRAVVYGEAPFLEQVHCLHSRDS